MSQPRDGARCSSLPIAVGPSPKTPASVRSAGSTSAGVRGALPAEPPARTWRVSGHGDLPVPVARARQTEAHPRRVVGVVRLEEGVGRVGRRNQVVVVSIREAGQGDLLAVRRLVVLVDPAAPDPLVGAVAVPERALAGRGVALKAVDLDQAEADLHGLRAGDRPRRAPNPYLEASGVGGVPMVVGRVVLEHRGGALRLDLVALRHLLRLRAALVERVVRADLLVGGRRLHTPGEVVLGSQRPRPWTGVGDSVGEAQVLLLTLVHEVQVLRDDRA